ncbi:MAG: sulfurtransferase complex subunit TusB [Nitrospirae bacterium CG22_combo_CG10-13_8_21_14_all_44_11]|nr:MAG: sulfurtransferase complex subunit TusB [Nitrospirae bacterium CG22_combo_CG10-13_8_21_14_all_44_11]PIV42652.1 MAG: sulfurtransferase complex subunit TusB [Nitrospirae bacterium CG02_land_8_20_14_3_00_44_33]PIV65428.1 MAG: sulfurtransferase complex subunit TusB [Nitrospirae bacterium CG01_land_8_20_14_3_00_44_22]PIW90195.1 MAG: sulfurtransferase complex subunit TusB [Nitrospirae bacterium CG_4_8_14_3_um_filter_44_28]PJA82991.1 MAG: sulfurtransferase complex subunit TusB [Nitrospirae bact
MGGSGMKLAVFVSDFKLASDTLDRLKADKLGIIFVANGVYHATTKENGKASHLLEKTPNLYAMSEDIQTRGMKDADVDKRVRVVNYGDVVDLIFNEYDKTAWL